VKEQVAFSVVVIVSCVVFQSLWVARMENTAFFLGRRRGVHYSRYYMCTRIGFLDPDHAKWCFPEYSVDT